MSRAALVAILEGAAGVTSLISTRIYPNVAPQNVTFPFLVYETISSTRETAMVDDPGVVRRVYQLTAYGLTSDVVASVIEACRAAVQRTRGTYAAVEVLDVLLEGEADFFTDAITPDGRHGVYGRTLDVQMIHRET